MRLDDTNIEGYLRGAGLLTAGGGVRIESAGDGNINFVRRAILPDGSSVVVKQARPELERFPEYRVSPDRMLFEVRYLHEARALAAEVSGLLPEVLHFDPENKIVAIEDLGLGPDLGDMLAKGLRVEAALGELGRFLGAVHARSADRANELRDSFRNQEMRELHGEHIFTLPFGPNDFPIAEGLGSVREALLANREARARIEVLRAAYYGSSAALVHADVQSGNILIRNGRPRLLDAEIAHFGDPAFDLGTGLAHVYLHVATGSGEAVVRTAESAAEALVDGYRKESGAPSDAIVARARAYAGVEMLRRTLGAARFPNATDGAAARALVEHALALLLEGPIG